MPPHVVSLLAMTEDDLVAFALNFPETTESAHFGTRDFRVRGKIFLTLPKKEFCVLKLTPDQQQMATATVPTISGPCRAAGGFAAGRGSYIPMRKTRSSSTSSNLHGATPHRKACDRTHDSCCSPTVNGQSTT